jgi:hypothetical protein
MPGTGMDDGTGARHASPLQGTANNCTECRGDACVALVNYGTPVNGNIPGWETDDINPGTGMHDGGRARHASPLQGTADNCSDCRGDACVALVNYGTPVNGNTPGTGMDDGTRARR